MLAASIAALTLDTLLDPSGLIDFLFFISSFVIIFAVVSVVFYLAGNVVVGRRKTSYKDAFAISVLGTLVLITCLSVFSLEVAVILSLTGWLLLFRYYYETGFLGSIAVAVTSVIIAVIIMFFLNAILGNSTLIFRWLPFFS